MHTLNGLNTPTFRCNFIQLLLLLLLLLLNLLLKRTPLLLQGCGVNEVNISPCNSIMLVGILRPKVVCKQSVTGLGLVLASERGGIRLMDVGESPEVIISL